MILPGSGKINNGLYSISIIIISMKMLLKLPVESPFVKKIFQLAENKRNFNY